MESTCLISVIIPMHNTGQYLRKCVECVRNHTLKGIEIILVENLSSDNSPQLCDKYTTLDKLIKVLHLSRSGLSVARNAELEVASAPFVGSIDNDDFIEPAMYEDMLKIMFDNTVGVVYYNYQLV